MINIIKRFGIGTLAALAIVVAISAPAHGYSNSRLMDDAVFDNVNSMSEQQIRTFINSRPNTCLATSGAIFPEPKDYFTYGPNRVDAARVVYLAAQYSNINPQVILSTLQKEQTLITRVGCFEGTSTIDSRNKAMGQGCPDGGACPAPAYAGFHQQVMKGAWQLKFNKERAVGNVEWGENGSIVYPEPYTEGNRKNCTTCTLVFRDGYKSIDGQLIKMETGATASFYRYTPHLGQALPGIFEGWFGPTLAVNTSTISIATISQPDAAPAIGQTVNYVVSFTNNLSSPITLDGLGVVGRLGSISAGANRDFGWQGSITLQPGVAQQFTFTGQIRDTGVQYVWPAIRYGGGYIQYNNWGTSMNAHLPNLTISSPLATSVSAPVAGQTITLSATIRNDEGQPIQLDSIGIPVRYYGAYNYDTAWSASASTIQPGATQVIFGNVVFDKPGPYTAWISAVIAGRYTTLSPTLSITTAKVTPSFILTYIETPNTTPALGEDVIVKFKLKNTLGVPITLETVGVVGRYDNPNSGINKDLGWTGSITFAAGEEKLFTTFVSNISALNNLYSWVSVRYQGSYTHYGNWGFILTPHLPNISISAPLTINSGSPPLLNQPTSVTVTLKNNEPRPIHFSAAGIPIRYYDRYNYDAGWQGAGVLSASGQSGDAQSVSGTVTFDKPGPYTLWSSILINGRYLTIGSQKQIQF